jgi:hypothetical protein
MPFSSRCSTTVPGLLVFSLVCWSTSRACLGAVRLESQHPRMHACDVGLVGGGCRWRSLGCLSANQLQACSTRHAVAATSLAYRLAYPHCWKPGESRIQSTTRARCRIREQSLLRRLARRCRFLSVLHLNWGLRIVSRNVALSFGHRPSFPNMHHHVVVIPMPVNLPNSASPISSNSF